MLTVILVRVIVRAAESEIKIMRTDNRYYCRYKKKKFVGMPYLLTKKQEYSTTKNNERPQAMMMFFPSMIQRVSTNTKGEQDHTELERKIIYNVNTKQWQ